MKIPVLNCENCGSRNLRRSHRRSVIDRITALVGVYPFRCLDCKHRFRESVWLLSKLHYAKCPKCLRLEVRPWPRKKFRLNAWQRFKLALGAHTYRCSPCRTNFISFCPTEFEDARFEPDWEYTNDPELDYKFQQTPYSMRGSKQTERAVSGNELQEIS